MIDYERNLVIDYNSDTEYQNTLLSLFSLNEFDESLIVEKIHEIYNEVRNIDEVKKEMEFAATLIGSEDEEMGLILLFSYENLPKIHKMLSKHLE